MKSEDEIRDEIKKLQFDMNHTQNFDEYKFYEGIMTGLKWVLDEETSSDCPNCGYKMVEGGLPPDDSGYVRLLCPNCGKWKWKNE